MMAFWHGYAVIEITISPPLTNPQKVLVRDAILELGRQTDTRPERITQFRASLDKQSALIEITIPERITKSQVVAKLANKLGLSEAKVTNKSNFTIFGGASATWQESRDLCAAWLKARIALWEENII